MTKAKTLRLAGLLFTVCGSLLLTPNTKADDFSRIVDHIEAEYHVHRNHRFLMFVAGVVVKCSHVAGMKAFKAALFEEQHLNAAELDAGLDDLVERASASGWQPLVKNVSRRSGEHTYIYAQTQGKDLRVLLVSVEREEAVVVLLKLDPVKLSDFINEHTGKSD